jgi:hypothetical protein
VPYPDLMTALEAYLTAREDLTYALRGPYRDEVPEGEPAPEGEAPPYVVYSQTGGGQQPKGSRGTFIDEFIYDFKVFHHDEQVANSRAKLLDVALKGFNKKPRPTFDDGSYLMSFLKSGPPTENKVPDSMSAGSKSLYRVTYTYTARVGGISVEAVP